MRIQEGGIVFFGAFRGGILLVEIKYYFLLFSLGNSSYFHRYMTYLSLSFLSCLCSKSIWLGWWPCSCTQGSVCVLECFRNPDDHHQALGRSRHPRHIPSCLNHRKISQKPNRNTKSHNSQNLFDAKAWSALP